MNYQVEHINKRIYYVSLPPPANEYSVNQSNTKQYSLTIRERAYEVTLIPAEYQAVFFKRPTYLIGSAPVINAVQYRPASGVSCSISLVNYGLAGEKELFWEVINDQGSIISSGSQMTGAIKKWETAIVNITGITAPADYQHFRVRIKISSTGSWLNSSYAYSLPVDLTVNSVNRNVDNYAPGSGITSVASVTNNGYSGAQEISWEVINSADDSIISSGAQSSGNVGDFATTEVNLTGITAPSFGCQFVIRARVGSGNWAYSNPANVLPVNLTITRVDSWNDFWPPDYPITPCEAYITNSGFAGSETIEWQVIKYSDSSVISSGSQSSGNVGDFASTNILLEGIFSPSTPNTVFLIRARIVGDPAWVNSNFVMQNMVPGPPPNPTPRGE